MGSSVPSPPPKALTRDSYWLCRVLCVRYVCFMYMIAFIICVHQANALIGPSGLTPATAYMEKIGARLGPSLRDRLMSVPSIFWLIEPSDDNIHIISMSGALLSAIIMYWGAANSIALAILWVLYMSIVNIGQTWYSFGWESQLLEVGFLAIFLVPFITISRFPDNVPMPFVVIWGYRWLIFRIMLGAGLIKIRGDSCWRDLTCMNYHYETQPVPNPLSRYLHFLPNSFHAMETMANHIVELVLPWLILVPYPRLATIVGGICQILFQVVLIFSGNLSFLNWLTIMPCICCFDDHALSFMFSKKTVALAAEKQMRWLNFRSTHLTSLRFFSSDKWLLKVNVVWRWTVLLCVGALIATLSVPVVQNLLSPSQAMNTSYDPFRIVNTYGAFGSITKTRNEVVLQYATVNSSRTEDLRWADIEFKCKPGDINRRPCLISPYHYRLDWLMWFAAFQSYQSCPWLVHLSYKLLKGDPVVLSLLPRNKQFTDAIAVSTADQGSVPYIRAQLYEYHYSDYNFITSLASSQENGWETGKWWKRKMVRNYMPPVSLQDDSVIMFLRHYEWID